MHTQNNNWKKLLPGAALCATLMLLALPACGGKHSPGTSPAPQPGPQVEVPYGMLAQLPALPPPPGTAAKTSSAARTSYISGIGLYQGEGYGVDGGSATLPSEPGKVVWAMYVGSSAGDDLDRLEVDVDMVVGAVYVAISDYTNGRWKFLGTLDAPGAFELPDSDYTKDMGGYYLLLLSWDGDFGRHNYTIAKYDDGDPQGPVISGTVTDENGAPLGGTTVYAMPGPLETHTDMNGEYSLSVPGDDSYTLNADKNGYSFTPLDEVAVVAGGADVSGVDFSGTSLDIRGTIMENGQPVAGVKLTFAGGGPVVYSRVDGTYEFSGMSSGMVTIVPKLAGYSFNPPTVDVDLQAMDINGADFSATGGQATFTISGNVNDLGTGTGLAGASVQLMPDWVYTQTDADGNYEFTGLAPDLYKVKAFKQNYTITPMEIDAPIVNLSVFNADFNAQPLFKVEGYVKGGGGSFPLNNVTVTLMPGGFTTQTNSQGYYAFGNRPPGDYTVTPSSNFYTFAPLSRPATIAGNSVLLDDFTGTLTGAVTYTNYISSSIGGACLSCHSDTAQNSVPPFLRNYSEANTHGALSNVRVQNGSMPPGSPLSAQSKELWQKWAQDGRPQ